MVRKKTNNGFMAFADSMRPVYENEAGYSLGPRLLVERATKDWTQMSKEDRDRWKGESKNWNIHHGFCNPSMIPNNPPRVRHRGISHIQEELLERAKRRGIDRSTATQMLTDKLTWRETESHAQIRLRRWSIVILSEEIEEETGAPIEVDCFSIEKGCIKSELRILAKGIEHENCSVRTLYWDPTHEQDVNTASIQITKFLSNCWNSLVMIPHHQFSRFSSMLLWMKETRDAYCQRETSSIRLDRLMCLEDVITVFRKLNGRPMIDSDEDDEWEELRGTSINNMLYGRAACEYFLSTMEKCTRPASTTVTSNDNISQSNVVSTVYNHAFVWKPHVAPFEPKKKMVDTNQIYAKNITLAATNAPFVRTMDSFMVQSSSTEGMGGFKKNPFEDTEEAAEQKEQLQKVTRWLDSISLEEGEMDCVMDDMIISYGEGDNHSIHK